MFNLKILIIITLFSLALQDSSILAGKQILYLAPVFMLISILLLFVSNYKYILNMFIVAYKSTPVRYYIWFVILILFLSFFQLNLAKIIEIDIRIFFIFVGVIGVSIFFPIIIIPRYISFKKMFKYLLVMYQFVIYYGILDYLFKLICGMHAPLYNILCTKSFWLKFIGEVETLELLVRSSSIFFEPSFFATFIFLFLPVVYIIYQSSYRFFKSNNLNILYKKYLIILTWVALITTLSPFYIIASLIYTLIFFYKNIVKLLLKKWTVFLTITLILFIISVILTVNELNIFDNKIVVRILNCIQNFNDLEALILVEPSMATRIISTINTYLAFLHHPFVGVGYGNALETMYRQYLSGATPLTYEIIYKGIMVDKCVPSSNIFWSTLLQSGVIATFILYLFILKTIYDANKIKNKFDNIDLLNLKILLNVSIHYVIIGFYWSLINYPMMWFILGMLNSYILSYKSRVKIIKKQHKFDDEAVQ